MQKTTARKLTFLVVVLAPASLASIRSARGEDGGNHDAPPTERFPIKCLFLGDNGHHRPRERANQLIPVLGGRGIALTYTDKLSDVNAANLAQYDCLIVYANIDRHQARARTGHPGLRRRRRRVCSDPLRVVLLP